MSECVIGMNYDFQGRRSLASMLEALALSRALRDNRAYIYYTVHSSIIEILPYKLDLLANGCLFSSLYQFWKRT